MSYSELPIVRILDADAARRHAILFLGDNVVFARNVEPGAFLIEGERGDFLESRRIPDGVRHDDRRFLRVLEPCLARDAEGDDVPRHGIHDRMILTVRAAADLRDDEVPGEIRAPGDRLGNDALELLRLREIRGVESHFSDRSGVYLLRGSRFRLRFLPLRDYVLARIDRRHGLDAVQVYPRSEDDQRCEREQYLRPLREFEEIMHGQHYAASSEAAQLANVLENGLTILDFSSDRFRACPRAVFWR